MQAALAWPYPPGVTAKLQELDCQLEQAAAERALYRAQIQELQVSNSETVGCCDGRLRGNGKAAEGALDTAAAGEEFVFLLYRAACCTGPRQFV